MIEERPEAVRAFLKAWFEAVEYRNTHVAETQEIAAKYLGVALDDIQPDSQLHIMTLADNQMIFQQTPTDGSRSIYDMAQISVDFLINIGSLSQQPGLKTIFDFSYQP